MAALILQCPPLRPVAVRSAVLRGRSSESGRAEGGCPAQCERSATPTQEGNIKVVNNSPSMKVDEGFWYLKLLEAEVGIEPA